ncbi:MAG TPA: DUF1801 domain-containing protein [Cyclobacteriaceae bacterium]|nr:DUF1801 domain-containing protein [Cyclobacteriaceae bacterium]HMV09380.1 DUF1801 domain-containing protein [Cyclobacteriaceae bacterium]HMV90711.1 DUF1801 domain-containing protein [Cyclobacteriaceae bacterium]HMX00971.1 DUF1801 domain-containing protein [Cyclobacteriaceae bacterium]HMX51111.1 DUF1801 domain-containing protein [Cyclobacteriaceae bacterium]
MRMQQFESVEAYLEAQSPEFREALEKLRAQIKAAAPKAEESISYGMPAYKYKGPLVYFGAFKKHCSFFPGSSTIIANQKELKGFTVAKGTIQFTPEKPLPAALVKRIVKERIRENETRDIVRQSKKRSR